MIPSLIITFRETLEATLVIGIVLSYLIKTKQTRYNSIVYIGIVGAIVASVMGAILFGVFADGFQGSAEEIFEGVVMLVGAALLTTMIFWMMKRCRIAEQIQEEVAAEISRDNRYGLFLLVFALVFREGVETVIFLKAASIITGSSNLVGAVLGITGAVVLGYVMFVASKKINIKRFFVTTSVLLVIFAAGLIARGVHELQEAHVIPIVVEHVWDINPQVMTGGGFPLMHEEGYIGGMFEGLFGYNGDPSLLETLSYAAYLLFAGILWSRVAKSKNKDETKEA